jgi:acyl-CoA synthetase (NDP forming)
MINLDKLFYPKSAAVVGASENKYKWGSFIFTNVVDGGFAGPVYPVTTSSAAVYGRRAYKALTEIEGDVDLVFITTPAVTVLGVLRECVAKGIKNVVMITSGFSETGEEGKRLEAEMVGYAKEHGINIVGPNTMGIVNTAHRMYATGTHVRPVKGGISIVAQSGNVGNQIMEWAEQQNVGIGKFIGSGNEGVLRCEDYLDYLNGDPDTSVILMYIEGIDDGRRFMEVAKNTTMKKPVIVLKAGRTDTGSKAAASHTGAMAGSYKTYETALRQSGVIVAKNPTDLLFISSAFDSLPLPKGNRVGVVTLGGGWGVITADECEERGLALPPLPGDVYKKLDAMLPPFWSRGNPVDLVGQPDRNLYIEATTSMAASPAFDAVIVLGIVGSAKFPIRIHEAAMRMGYSSREEIDGLVKLFEALQTNFLDIIIDLMEKYQKPIYPVSLIPSPEDKMVYMKEGKRYKVVIHQTPEEAVFCLERQHEYSSYLRKRSR